MTPIPPFILVFDISALSTASPTEWREFSRVGSCFIPQVVYEEIRLLFQRSPDPDLERIAKAFNRFYASSGWQVTDTSAHHPELKVGSGKALTRRARVSLAVGRCAYGLSQSFSRSIVILVSKDLSLLQRLYEIPSPNLCGITGEVLLQWSRTGQRPVAVSQKLQQFRAAHNIPPAPAAGGTSTSSSLQLVNSRSASLERGAVLARVLLAVVVVAIATYLVWQLFHPTPPLPKPGPTSHPFISFPFYS